MLTYCVLDGGTSLIGHKTLLHHTTNLESVVKAVVWMCDTYR